MKNVSESLAGRIGILNLLGSSLREKTGVKFNEGFIPTEDYFNKRKSDIKDISYDDVWKSIHRGVCLSCVVTKTLIGKFSMALMLKSIQRNVRELTQIGDENKFLRFMTAAATNIGNLVNLASIARDIGISHPTAKRWLSIFVTSNIVYLLKSYSNNITK